MITDIQNKKDEVHNIWLENKDKMSASELYKTFLGEYFDVANYTFKHYDWLFFIKWVNGWKKELRKGKRAEDLSDEELDDIQDKNRKRMIIIMESVLKKYENDPKKMENIPIEEVRRLYKAIQSIEESMKRTQIAKGKLGLDTAKAILLPYARMNPKSLLALKEQLNESLNRIIEIKSKGLADGIGQDNNGAG